MKVDNWISLERQDPHLNFHQQAGWGTRLSLDAPNMSCFTWGRCVVAFVNTAIASMCFIFLDVFKRQNLLTTLNIFPQYPLSIIYISTLLIYIVLITLLLKESNLIRSSKIHYP